MTTATDIEKKKPLSGLADSGAYQKLLKLSDLVHNFLIHVGILLQNKVPNMKAVAGEMAQLK